MLGLQTLADVHHSPRIGLDLFLPHLEFNLTPVQQSSRQSFEAPAAGYPAGREGVKRKPLPQPRNLESNFVRSDVHVPTRFWTQRQFGSP